MRRVDSDGWTVSRVLLRSSTRSAVFIVTDLALDSGLEVVGFVRDHRGAELWGAPGISQLAPFGWFRRSSRELRRRAALIGAP